MQKFDPKFKQIFGCYAKFHNFVKKKMKEEFLHYLWKYRLFMFPLKTTEGEPVEVIKPGIHNTDAGPDFTDARLRIGDTMWAGNVEIHLQSSSWYDHKHNSDNAYDNVILHVVLNKDATIKRSNGQVIPCLECNTLIPMPLYEKYKGLMGSRLWVPCARIIRYCPELVIASWIEAQLVERLNRKSKSIESVLQSSGNDWEETFYRQLARCFGLKINTVPFEMLATALPHRILARHQDQPLQIEALIFGQAGFLNENCSDPYFIELRNEFEHLKNKYTLRPLDVSVWKFLRLRPSSFPTIRLAQFAALMQQSESLFSLILEASDLAVLKSVFRARINHYWDDHYLFGRKSENEKEKFMGEDSIDIVLINAVVPVLFLYGKYFGYQEYVNKALALLEQLPAENNSIIKKWRSLGIKVPDAFTSQALINLKQEYCDQKRCLYCRIGNELLK
jgi:hypothetical protein